MQEINVNTSSVVAQVAGKPVGISVDYLRDMDSNRPAARPIAEALREMGAAWLRYPGGGKSDSHLWSTPPWDKPRPQIYRAYADWAVGHEVMDFDAFIALSRQVGAEPYVVVGCKRAAQTPISVEQYFENAVEWVRYANVTKGYGVRYWEIGNENWLNDINKPEEMAPLVVKFSRAMKAVDPTILVGSNGFGMSWWEKFLPVTAGDLDFLSISNYPCSTWMGYDYYRSHAEVVLCEQARIAAEAIEKHAPPADQARLFVAAVELNSMDYATGGWPNRNNLGHALVTAEIFGQLLQTPRVRAALLWNTRWVEPEPETIWYALGKSNELLPAGRAVAAWGRFLHDTFVACTRTDTVVTFASHCEETGKLSVWLINKDLAPASVSLKIEGPHHYAAARRWCFHGQGPDDMQPLWEELGSAAVVGNQVKTLPLPGPSLTVLAVE
ncbi:MAG: hypothetical protein LLG01_00245 [Planctomycetaceae bacterium]|nr:hypothetical protein [Planctomycetaceae bacterium]